MATKPMSDLFDIHKITQKARFDRICAFISIEINEYAQVEVFKERERCANLCEDSGMVNGDHFANRILKDPSS